MQDDRNKRIKTGSWLAVGIVMSMTLIAGAAPINDECSQAIELTANDPYWGTTLGATGEYHAGCGGANDVWFRYSPAQTGLFEVTLAGEGSFSAALSLYDSCQSWMLDCTEDGYISFNGQAGNTYWIRVAGFYGLTGDFTIEVVTAAPPANDDCSSAIPLDPAVPVNGSTVGTSPGSVSSCSYYDFYDVWYSFTAAKTGPYDIAITNSNFDQTVVVYDTCYGDELVCNGNPWWNPITRVDLAAGQNCLIRIAGYNEQTGTFTISVNYIPPTLDLRSPLAGGVWPLGLPIRIAWDTTGSVPMVRLEYSADGGAQWTDIATVENVGSYEWPGPSAAGGQYLIRIRDAADPTIAGTTDGVFSVAAATCDQLLDYARSRIFEQTVSGIRAAYSALGQVVSRPDCAGSARLREARFLHAVTRIAMLALADDAAEPQSVLETARQFGVELVGDILGDLQFKYPTNNHDYYEIPAGAPNWDAIKQIIETTGVAEIDAILAELNLITETSANRFRVWFTPQETGQTNPIEVDYAEVLILKSVLKWAKGWILAESAYDLNMTEEDQKLLQEKMYGNAVSVNLDILNKYPNFLKVLPTTGHPENGKAMLADARKSVLEAIGDILAAMTYMESENVPVETDPQNDELLFIDSSNLREVNIVRQRLNTFRGSLLGDTAGVYTFEDERDYQLTNPSQPEQIWYLNITGFDPFDRPDGGSFWTNDPAFWGSWTISGSDYNDTTFLIEMEDVWGYGGATLSGTISADKTQLTQVVFEYWGWTGQGTLENLTGTQTLATTTEAKVNLNPIFGSSTKYPNPVSPRNMLPTFTDFNWVLPNTMGAGLGNNATLGGVLPDMTQADWNKAFNARPASEYPAGTIEGTIQFNGWVDEPIYIQAYSKPGEFESTISETMITKPGAYALKGITVTGQAVYVRAFVPVFGFKIFELGAFEIEEWAKVQMSTPRVVGVNLTLQRPTAMVSGVWYTGALNSEMALRRHYSFSAVKDQKYCFQLDTSLLSWATVVLYSRNGQTELVERFPFDTQEIVDWVCPIDGQFFIEVRVPDWNPWMAYTGTYRLRMLVPTPDINDDGCVDLADLSLVAAHWLDAGCELGNDFCEGLDLDHDGRIDMVDFSLISAEWKKCQPRIPEGLIAYWPMDDKAASKTVLDNGGGSYHGAAQQNTSALTRGGKIGTALAFNGTTDWIDCGTNAALMPDAWTLCAWIQCTNVTTPMLISFGGNYPSIKLQNTSDGKPRIHLGQSNYRYFAASAWTTLKDGQWHFVAFTVPGKAQADIQQAQMYVDGVAVAGDAPVATGAQASKTHVYLGANPPTGTQRFGGAVDEVMLFDRALTEAEIVLLKKRTR